MLEQRTQSSCPEVAAPYGGTELSPRIRGLREMYWARTHVSKVLVKELTGSAEPTFVAKARNFELRLEESPPLIQDDELLAGVALVRPKDPKAFDLGYYNSHYPPGHPNMLRLGFNGIRDRAKQKLAAETDPKKRDFLEAVAISYDAACRFAREYATYLRRLSAETLDPTRRRELAEIAKVCEQIAEGPPRTFHAALQQFWFVFMFGGCGCIGRFDQWMYPFLRRDLDEGRLTKAQAQELLDSLWIKLNFFAGNNDSLRNIALAGQTADGQDGCNELTYMCLEATEKLRLPEPKIAVRFFRGSPRALLEVACRVNAKGLSMPSLFNDEVAIPALRRLGIPLDDARQYCNDGCEELIIGSKCAITFSCFDSVAMLNETVFRAEQQPYASFDEVLADYKERLKRWMPDNHGQPQHITFPFFAGAIDDCLENATTEPHYSIWGNIL
ncbi:MAG: hypothetical protein FJ279_15215, partial [Planctomycetes bacterium]|nr:hypothetical protein [Planctomycetota bacterium]